MASEDATLINSNINIFRLQSDSGDSTFPLRGEMLVGRELDCEVMLDYGHISRYHAKLNVSPGGVYIEDLHSTNGTFINGNRIRGRVRLNLGDTIAFDDIVFRLEADVGEPASNDTDDLVAWPVRGQAQYTPARAPREDAGDRTQVLSSSQVERIVSRSRSDHIDNDFGSGARVIVTTAPLRGKTFELAGATAGTEWAIGRDVDADINLNDATISLHHATIYRDGDEYSIALADGGNGLLVNGQSVRSAALNHDDRVQLGRMELLFRSDVASDAYSAEAAEDFEKSPTRHWGWTALVLALSAVCAVVLAIEYNLI